MPATTSKTVGTSRVSVRALDGFFRRCDTLEENLSVPRLFQRFTLTTSSWSQLAAKVAAAQDQDATGKHIKVLFFLRHGEGHHNVAAASMGKARWNAEGAYQSRYIDAQLTAAGIVDARQRGPKAMELERRSGMPAIQRVVTSPLTRAIETASCFFRPSMAPRPFVAMEKCREVMDTHVCNQRRAVSELRVAFPDVDFSCMDEEEEDEDAFYSATQRESFEQQDTRIVMFLAQVCRKFPNDTFIAVASHADFMRSMWVLLFGERLKPSHCEVFPVVVEVVEEH